MHCVTNYPTLEDSLTLHCRNFNRTHIQVGLRINDVHYHGPGSAKGKVNVLAQQQCGMAVTTLVILLPGC